MLCLLRLSFGAFAVALLEQTVTGVNVELKKNAGAAFKTAAHKISSSSHFAPMPLEKEVITRTRDRIHVKLAAARAQAQGKCHGDDDRQPSCKHVLDLLDILIDESTGEEPKWGFLNHVRFMLGLSFWLYTPGPAWSFHALDRDNSGTISWPEFHHTFTQVESVLKIFMFMDTNTDNSLSKPEVVDFLRTAVKVRELVPDVDDVDPETSSDIVMQKIDAMLEGRHKRMSTSEGSRLAVIKAISIGICVLFFGSVMLYVCIVRSRESERLPQPEKEGKKEGKK